VPKSNQYVFLTRWRVRGTPEEVFDLISNPLDYPRWWPSVYLETTELEPADARGLGHRIHYHTKGWLPYTLRWESVSAEADRPRRITIRAAGDFDGRGIWTFDTEGDWVHVTFDWQLTADKPLLRYLSFLLKPIFAANHRWAMARGEESLQLEINRHHTATPAERERVPAPPGPNKTSGLWLALAAAAIIAIVIALVWFL
jgi:uncharacterized protein YndB with AHSA1/START domain